MATVRDFVRKSSAEAPGPAHPCNAFGLSPLEFLQAVYRDPLLPMSIRIDAARGLLPYTEPRPTNTPPWNGCTIVIPPFDYEPRTPDPGSVAPPPEQINSDRPSNPLSASALSASANHPAQSELPPEENLTT